MSIAEKLAQIAVNEQKVYDAGKKAEYDAFWDRFQQNGTADYYAPTGRFAGHYWGFHNFFPKYDIKPEGNAERLFYNWNTNRGEKIGSLKQRLEECGVVLDTSKATHLANAFAYCGGISELPTIDFTGMVGSPILTFSYCYDSLKTIEKLIVNENIEFDRTFHQSRIENIKFEGVIGHDIDFGYSTKLSADSIINIIEHLSLTASGKTLTLSKAAVDKAFEESEGANNGSQSREWEHWIGTKQTWTISLV